MLTVLPFSRSIARVAVVTTIVLVGMPQSAKAQNNTQRGATFGGITGAIAGAIIGENNDEAGAGAAIGGAIGAVAGGLFGNANDKDNRIRQQQIYQQSQQYAAPVYAAPQPTGAVSFADVIAMSRSGVGDNVILNQVQTRGVQRQPVVSDIISLHQQGVSENVIAAMQQAPTGSQLANAPIQIPRQTIVETPVIVQPRIHTYGVPRGAYYHRGPVYRARPSYQFHYGH